MKLVYFAWVKDRIGKAGEEMALPAGVRNVGELLAHLKSLSEGHAKAFAEPQRLRIAVNLEYASFDRVLSGDEEVAIFPPVTGG